jgi:hypothetical protein
VRPGPALAEPAPAPDELRHVGERTLFCGGRRERSRRSFLDMLTEMGELPPGFLLQAIARGRGGRGQRAGVRGLQPCTIETPSSRGRTRRSCVCTRACAPEGSAGGDSRVSRSNARTRPADPSSPPGIQPFRRLRVAAPQDDNLGDSPPAADPAAAIRQFPPRRSRAGPDTASRPAPPSYGCAGTGGLGRSPGPPPAAFHSLGGRRRRPLPRLSAGRGAAAIPSSAARCAISRYR